MLPHKKLLQSAPLIPQDPANFDVLLSAHDFRVTLLKRIKEAKKQIHLVALYLEDDEAGREVLTALYEAKQTNPEWDVHVCVDWHRAQRSRMGENASRSNAQMYEAFSNHYKEKISVHGVPIQSREVFGVLHLKGFIIDDTLIYSGASLNNIYLNYHDRYRFDRYYVIENSTLSTSMREYIQHNIINHPAVHELDIPNKPTTKDIRPLIKQFRPFLSRSSYVFPSHNFTNKQVGITPISGLGKRRNALNSTITQIISQAEKEIFICTPYFNFPKNIAQEIKKTLKRGVKVTIVVGDKTANDFYLPPEEEYHNPTSLPYYYEVNLRRYAKLNESNIARRDLSLHLWKDGDNSFHLKGIWADKKKMLITGHNLNPRAWNLDIENGLLIQDPYGHLVEKFEAETANILIHTEQICTYRQIAKFESYPLKVRKFLKRLARTRADKLFKKIL